MLRVKLLRLSRALLLVEVGVFTAVLALVRREVNKIDCADPLTGCEKEQFTFYLTVLKPVLFLLVAQKGLVWLISAVRWLLAQANITVLQIAAHFNLQWLAALVVTPQKAVADYSRTRPAVFGTVAAVLRLDRAAAAVVTVRDRAAEVVAAVLDDDLVAADSTVPEHDDADDDLRSQQPVSTLSSMLCNSEATLIDFSAVGTACDKGWDRALVLRLLYTWMQSPQGQRADVMAKLARSKDYTALQAILRMYELCDLECEGYSSDDSASDYDDSDSATLEPMWEAWLNGSMARMICTLCELHTVSDRCHLADETTVLTAVAAVKVAVERQYKQQHREKVMQFYAYRRLTDGDAVQGDAADTEQGTINTESEQHVVEQSARADSSGHSDIHSGGAFADVQHGVAPNSSISSSAGTDISTAPQSVEHGAAAITTAADASTQTATRNADDNTAAEAAERAVATPVVAATTAAAEGESNASAAQQQARPLTALSEPRAADKLTQAEVMVSEQCSELALQDVQLRERDGTIQRLDEHMLLKRREHVTTETELLAARLELKGERIGHAATKRELAAVTQQLLHTCSKLDTHEAEAADIADKLSDIEKREAQLTAAAAKAEGIKRELRTLRNRDVEHNAALQQCRDEAAVAAADAAKQLKAVTEQFDELEDRSVCVVCQHDPKQVLLQPCLHLCLCVKCSTSSKIVDCPICRATIDYKETVHLC
jgi:Zinc finger, C3HC4 type (RING finger)